MTDQGVGQKSLGNVVVQPYFLTTPQFYMVGQERQRHDEAVYRYGEYSIFILFWNAFDYGAGLVQHCPQCYSTNDGISATYNQPSYTKCNLCYGTTFFLLSAGVDGVGGVKGRIIRPALWQSYDMTQKQTASGEVTSGNTSIQSVSDFRMRTGDVVIKADSTRWRISSPGTQEVVSGFQPSNDVRAMTGFNYGQVVREDVSMPSYLVPVGPGAAPGDPTSLLSTQVIPNYPLSFSSYEIVNGDLIGNEYTNTENAQTPIEGD